MTWTILARFLPWRYVGYGLGAVALLALGWRVHAWHEAYKALPEAQAALEREVACEVGSKCAERVAALQARQAAISQQVVSNYESELAALRNRPVPTRVIRVCRPAGTGDVSVPAGPGGTPAAAGSGLVHGADEFDTGPLRDLARQADEVSAAYRALRARDEALAGE